MGIGLRKNPGEIQPGAEEWVSQFTNNSLIIMVWETIATNLSNIQIFKKWLLWFVLQFIDLQ